MRRGTTPTHTFTLPFDTGLIKSVRVVYAQGGKVVLTKNTDDCTLDGNTISYKLTQEESLCFRNNQQVEIQVRVLTASGESLASDVMSVFVGRCLDDEVIK